MIGDSGDMAVAGFIKAAVLGHPARHSLSPLIHNYWRHYNGLQGSYDIIDVPPGGLPAQIDKMTAEGYAGFNVTLPYKQEIMALCTDIDAAADKIGAVNTVTIKSGGRLYGMNTDIFGFMANLEDAQPDFDAKDKMILVLGAGGAARAAVYGLLAGGAASVVVANRTLSRARALVADLSGLFPGAVRALAWDARYDVAGQADMVVNTTSLGMAGQAALDFDCTPLRPGTLVYDIVYRPLLTDLLKQAQEHGLPVVTGIGMLVHQARPGFAQWTGIMPAADEILLKKVTEQAQ